MTSTEPIEPGRSDPPLGDIRLEVDTVTGDLMDALIAVSRVYGVGVDGCVLTVEHAGVHVEDVRQAAESVGTRVVRIGFVRSPFAERSVDEEGEPHSFDVEYREWRDAD